MKKNASLRAAVAKTSKNHLKQHSTTFGSRCFVSAVDPQKPSFDGEVEQLGPILRGASGILDELFLGEKIPRLGKSDCRCRDLSRYHVRSQNMYVYFSNRHNGAIRCGQAVHLNSSRKVHTSWLCSSIILFNVVTIVRLDHSCTSVGVCW